jgi:2-polyprenyl-3-methyl-5-hydroxy-6-metoxy-1,4-benzoquinol methylase
MLASTRRIVAKTKHAGMRLLAVQTIHAGTRLLAGRESTGLRGHHMCHYSVTPYYPLYAVVAYRAKDLGSVLELGCGTGQLAHILHDWGCRDYWGVDVNPAAISAARARVPGAEFYEDDILVSPLLETLPYNVVVATEVLEHVLDDIAVVARVRSGTRVVASVPNFYSPDHARTFTGCVAVRERYAKVLGDLSVVPLRYPQSNAVFFILEGVRT